MENKSNKYKFVKKNSPDIQNGKKFYPQYSKIINSIFSQIKIKQNNKNKINREITDINKEKNIIPVSKFNIVNNSKKYILSSNKLKDLFNSSSFSTINYYSNSNQKDIFNKKNYKISNGNNLSNIKKKINKKTDKNQSEKNIKMNCDFYLTSNNNYNNYHDKEIGKNSKIIETNINKIYSKYKQENGKVNHNINKNTINNNNNELKYIPLKNKTIINDYYTDNLPNNYNSNNKHYYEKRNIFDKSSLNSKKLIKNKVLNKKIVKIKNKNNKYIIDLNNNNSNNSNNSSLNNFGRNNLKLRKNKEKVEKNNNFEGKNISNGKEKTSKIDIKDKIEKIDLSEKSLCNSFSTIAINSKDIRSLSKKRDEKKKKNLKENELYSERANKKIFNLYLFINEQNNNLPIKNNPHIKLIDKIRRKKKLNCKNIYIKTE